LNLAIKTDSIALDLTVKLDPIVLGDGQEVQKSLGLVGQPDPMLVGPAWQEDPTLREKKFNPTQP
jgi:hypothetical protein